MDLVSRLKIYMDKNGISSSLFADTCNIPRPTMSQILNGRNKKISDELISKIHSAYPDLSVLWLMFGEGNMTALSNIQISEAKNLSSSEFDSSYPAVNDRRNDHNNHVIDDNDFTTDEKSIFFVNKSYKNMSGTSVNEKNTDENYLSSPYTRKTTDNDGVNTFIDFHSDNDNKIIYNDKPSEKNPTHPQNTTVKEPIQRENNTRSHINNIGHNSILEEKSDQIDTTISPDSSRRDIKISTDMGKRITNIVVFYSDNSFQSFYPASF